MQINDQKIIKELTEKALRVYDNSGDFWHDFEVDGIAYDVNVVDEEFGAETNRLNIVIYALEKLDNGIYTTKYDDFLKVSVNRLGESFF